MPFFAGAALLDQLEEDAARGAPAGTRFDQHAPIAFNLKRVGKDGSTALLPELPQHPGEQGFLGLL
jgi:hypothetical protein